jgi:nucleolar GTP-binding protein
MAIIKPDANVKNLRNQQRKFSATTMDALMKGLTIPITNILDSYKQTFRELHPFEATVADLTIAARVKAGHSDLESILSSLKELRVKTNRIAKDYASRASNATSSVEAKSLLEEGMSTLESYYKSGVPPADSLAMLVELQKDLRRIPVVELDTPTVVLVGAPNVGKSSIVRAVSSGTPEVNDYPFTTRGVTIGHIVDPSRDLRFQVMDTPGLLDRPAEDRNEMEKLTFASLAHLPTAVIFVIDPSGLSGEQSNLQAQLNVRNHLKQRFPRRPWIDVVSKGDLDIAAEVASKLPEGYLSVSVKSGKNVEFLKEQIEDMLLQLQEMLQQVRKNST